MMHGYIGTCDSVCVYMIVSGSDRECDILRESVCVSEIRIHAHEMRQMKLERVSHARCYQKY